MRVGGPDSPADTGHIRAVTLRNFREEDLPLLDAWANDIGSERYMSRYAPVAGRVLAWYVIQAQGRDVGTVWLEQETDPREARLGIMLADPSLLGRGIGRQAIQLAIGNIAKTRSIDLIHLHAREDNARAIACYRHCGFEIIDSGSRSAAGRAYRFWRMERRL